MRNSVIIKYNGQSSCLSRRPRLKGLADESQFSLLRSPARRMWILITIGAGVLELIRSNSEWTNKQGSAGRRAGGLASPPNTMLELGKSGGQLGRPAADEILIFQQFCVRFFSAEAANKVPWPPRSRIKILLYSVQTTAASMKLAGPSASGREILLDRHHHNNIAFNDNNERQPAAAAFHRRANKKK